MTTVDEREPWEAELDAELLPEPVPAPTVRTVDLATTGVDHSLNIRVEVDVSRPAEHVMHVLWAAAGRTPDRSALITMERSGSHEYWGVADAWADTSNEDAVHDLGELQFAQLFRPDAELYAEIDPARGWRARITLDRALDDEAHGDPGCPVRVLTHPFGVPATNSAAEIDVVLKASEGESLTPLEQQVLVQLRGPLEVPFSECAHERALATLAAVSLGLSPRAAEVDSRPLTTAAAELFLQVGAHDDGVAVTRTSRLTAAEARRLLERSSWLRTVQALSPEAVRRVRLSELPLVTEAWSALRDSGILHIRQTTESGHRALIDPQLAWLLEADAAWRRVYLETLVLRWLIAEGRVPGVDAQGDPRARVVPTNEFDSAQDYADSLISDAMMQTSDVAGEIDAADDDAADDESEVHEHVEVSVQLQGLEDPVIRRMSVPVDANLHAAVEAVLVMFGWELVHLWDLAVADGRGRELLATSSEGVAQDSEAVLAAEMRVGDVLRADGPRLLLTYDFGDSWEMVLSPRGSRSGGPDAELLGVEGHCPPEDSGGPEGYLRIRMAVDDPEAYAREYPDDEPATQLAHWARAAGLDERLPELGHYEIDENPLPYP